MTKKALLIGCNYKNTSYQLNGCINDAFLMRNLLEKKKYNEILVLHDDAIVKPTKQNILEQMEKMFLSCKEGDELFLSFSGHGTQAKDLNGDEKDGKDEVFISLDLKGIYDDEVRRLYQKIPKGVKVFVVMDCCNSGTILDLPMSLPCSRCSSVRNNYFLFDADIFMISGCRDPQYSFETVIDNKTHGLLTYSFYKTMVHRPKITGRFFMREIEKYIVEKYYKQDPQLSSSKKVRWSTTEFRL
jgi:hypothetical protein